ncbi:MAG: glycosyltransferase family A protein [Pseudomonadota bacterium]
MSDINITAIVTAHSESTISGPTMASAEAAIAHAQAAGFTVERLIGLDTPSSRCRAYFGSERFDNWRRIDLECRDQGKARNMLAEEARGHWLAFLDADDLWSENWLTEAARTIRQAEEAGQKTIVHPELNWVFDRHANILVKVDQDSPFFQPHYFYFMNYYDALCMAQRSTHLEFPYAGRDMAKGLAFEDLQWNIETIAGGWCHKIVPDTVIFKRRQLESQTIRASRRKVVIQDLDAMRIDRISDLGS